MIFFFFLLVGNVVMLHEQVPVKVQLVVKVRKFCHDAPRMKKQGHPVFLRFQERQLIDGYCTQALHLSDHGIAPFTCSSQSLLCLDGML